jgi:hypothetical protein
MITIAVPYKGRSLEQVLDRFVDIEAISKRERNFFVDTTNDDKKRISKERDQLTEGRRRRYSSNTDVEKRLQAVRRENSLGFGLNVGYDLLRTGQPARIFFKTLDTHIDGVPVRLIGRSHYDIPTALRNHEVQLGFVGWDELYADHVEHLTRGDIREWGAMNAFLKQGSTDVRVLGSADLQDYVGHFMLLDHSIGRQIIEVMASDDSAAPYLFRNHFGPPMDVGGGEFGPVYVDHKYQKIYQAMLPNWTAKFIGSDNVERDVRKNKGVGLYVVQSGKTITAENLHIVGPLFFSETIIAVNEEDYLHNPDVSRVASRFQPRRQDCLVSQIDYTWWQVGLLNNAGDNYHYCSELGLGYIPGQISKQNIRRAA